MKKGTILWIDDEIDLLKSHIIFLKDKGYEVYTASNGDDGIELIKSAYFDIIFLDENMPGLSGLETLNSIKMLRPSVPIVMITKSEEENIMDEAIGSNIDDYLIKPVKPNQILLCLKKNLEDKKLKNQTTTLAYNREFRNLSMELSSPMDYEQWKNFYRKLVYWELAIESSTDTNLREILQMQKDEANEVFSKFYINNYRNWIQPYNNDDKPIFSHTLLRNKVFPHIDKVSEPIFLILIDNLRYDQWKTIQPIFEQYFYVEEDDLFYSIIPSVTEFSRNAIFSGLMPSEIQKRFPHLWVYDDEEDVSKNTFEHELLMEHLKMLGKNIKVSFNKILNLQAGKKLIEQLPNLMNNKLNVIIYNFVDVVAHAKTEMEIIKELAADEAAYRAVTLTWLNHSPLLEVIKYIAEKKAKLFLTTDHGSVRIKNPVKIIGDRETNTNIRFKYGKNLNVQSKDVYHVMNPADLYLPRPNVSTTYVFCTKNDFLVYPKNYNYFVKYFADSFQHGGVSLEEILVPIVTFKAR